MRNDKGNKIQILRVFPTTSHADRSGVVRSFTPFRWCVLSQGVPLMINYGWGVSDGRISPPQYRSGKMRRPYAILSEMMLKRLWSALVEVGAPVDPYRPKALAWTYDAYFLDKCSNPVWDGVTPETPTEPEPSDTTEEEPNA